MPALHPISWLCVAFLVTLLTGCSQPEEKTSDALSPATTADAPAAENGDPASSESARLNAWLDERFEEQLLMNPTWLTQMGRKERYDAYDDLSEAGRAEQLAWLGASVTEMVDQFDYDRLDLEARTSFDLWRYRYELTRDAHEHRRQTYVFTQMMGPQSRVPQFMISYHSVDTEEDMVAYVSRIEGISQAILDLLETAQTNAAAGTRPPRFAYEVASQEARKLSSGAPFDNGPDSPLWADAKAKIAALEASGDIDAERAEELREAARTALARHFMPAYESLAAWLDTDIDNASLDARGALALPDGQSYYAYRLRALTTTDMSAEEIHELGLAEVDRIRGEMDRIREQVGFEGDLQAFFQFMKEDPRFLYPNTDEGRQGYLDDSAAYLDFINERLPDYFGMLPKADLVVRRVEPFREQDGAPQHYYRGTPDGSKPGIYFAHLSDMNAMPKHLMEAVAYHEGNPGHHMQISIAQELTDVPLFRTRSGYTAYIEGWGLYAELLAREMGAYQDPYSDFGRLSTEMWRAIRLVVDTGIHAKGWSEEGAVAYFKENSAIADGAIRAEVQRYFVMPGQATAYKIGMLKILELRAAAEAALGDAFDIRAFHDTVLGGGALPLAILERRVQNWVEAVQAASAEAA